MAKPTKLFAAARVRASAAVLLVIGALALVVNPASAEAAFTVTPITFNVVGLDSNNVNVGPNTFPVGARVCNTGDAAATNAAAALAWGSVNPYLSLTSEPEQSLGTIAAGDCRDVFFTVAVTRTAAAYDTTRRFSIGATADGGVAAQTASTGELYVEHLVSQNRNAISKITGPSTVYVGSTVSFTLDGSTATQGYEQLETFLNLHPDIFEVQSVAAAYSSPTGGTNDKVWADACRFDFEPASATYRECVGPNLYAGGKAGGTVKLEYTVRIVGAGSAVVDAMIYDFSGSSYHYNSDYGSAVKSLAVTAVGAADLSITSTHDDPFTRGGTGAYTWRVTNAGPSAAAGPVTVTSTLPDSVTFAGGAGAGATCNAVGQEVACALAAGVAVGETVPLTIDVAVSPDALASFTTAVSVAGPTHDPDATNNVASDPTTTVGPTTTTTEPAQPTTTTSTTEPTPSPTTTSTTQPDEPASSTTTTTTSTAPSTTTTTAARTPTTTTTPPTTTTTTRAAPTTTTTTTPPTTTTVAPPPTTTATTTAGSPSTTTTTTTAAPTTSTTAKPATPTTMTTAPDSLLGMVVDQGDPLPPIVEPGDANATYTLVSGTIPPGTWLLADGTFGGSPSRVGTYEFEASVCDLSGRCSVRHVTVKVLGVQSEAAVDPGSLARTGNHSVVPIALGLLLVAAGAVTRRAASRCRP